MNEARFTVFGIPMQRQRTRRRLVVATYAVLAAVVVTTIVVAPRWPFVYSYAIYATMAVALFIFGGMGQRGLLKGFEDKRPRPESPQTELLRLHLAPQTILLNGDSAWRNDERELARRDLAHYRAYQPLTLGALMILLLAQFALHPPRFISTAFLLQALFAVAEAMTVLALTLPAAIILWTETDIEIDLDSTTV